MGYYMFDHETANRSDLSLGEKILLCVLRSLQGKKSNSFPSQKTLAAVLSCSITTVKTLTRSLELKGEITKYRLGNNQSNRYATDSQNPAIPQDRQSDSAPVGVKPRPCGSQNPAIHIIDQLLDQPPDQATGGGGGEDWRVGYRDFLVANGYAFDEARDGHAVVALERWLSSSDVTREQANAMLSVAWDDWTEKKIESIPAIMLHRLKKEYGR